MLEHIPLEQVMVLDIETVPQFPSYNEVPPEWQELWAQKTTSQRKDIYTPEEFYDRAGIWAEFGKIVCISVGIFTKEGLRVKSFCDAEEVFLLQNFIALLKKQPSNLLLCAHNGKEFDFPYLCRRMLINSLEIPHILQIAGKKPWEVQHLDTMELWKFGDNKHYTSLKLLCQIFNVPTPKNDISGADVGRVFWEEQNLDRIQIYCEKDVIATCQLFKRFRGEPLVEDENIVIVK